MLQYFLFFKRLFFNKKETFPKHPFILTIKQKDKIVNRITFYIENNTFLESTTKIVPPELQVLLAEQPKHYNAITIGINPTTRPTIYPIILKNAPAASRQHGTIRLIDNIPYYENNGKNGTVVNDELFKEKIRITKLNNNSTIYIGKHPTKTDYEVEINVTF